MRETINAHRAGTTTAMGWVHYVVPLDNPEADGNMGLQGFNDHFEQRRFPNAGLARRWCETQLANLDGSQEAKVTVERWDRDVYDDDRYGRILDVECIEITQQYGYLQQDGTTVVWDDPEPVPTWS